MSSRYSWAREDWPWGGIAANGAVSIAGRGVLQSSLLADGGFAYVYRGSDARTGEPLAIRRVLLQDSKSMMQAREEIALLESLLPHRHLVRYLGAEIVMAAVPGRGATVQQAVSLFELCTGGTLLARLEKAVAVAPAAAAAEPLALPTCVPCLPEPEVLDVLGATAAALAHLHAQGVIHYDVKSENLLLGADGIWKLGDFGSASKRCFDLAGASRRTLLEVEEFIHGRCTPIYRPPEVADVHLRWHIGPKADIFATGCVLFATLTGRHPFPMDSALANIQANFQLPAKVASAYPQALPRWVRRMLAREPDSRPRAAEVEAEIQRFRSSGEEPPDASTSGAAVSGALRPMRHQRSQDTIRVPAMIPVALAPDWVADFGNPQGVGTADGLQGQQVQQPHAHNHVVAAEGPTNLGHHFTEPEASRLNKNARALVDQSFQPLADNDDGPPRQGPSLPNTRLGSHPREEVTADGRPLQELVALPSTAAAVAQQQRDQAGSIESGYFSTMSSITGSNNPGLRGGMQQTDRAPSRITGGSKAGPIGPGAEVDMTAPECDVAAACADPARSVVPPSLLVPDHSHVQEATGQALQNVVTVATAQQGGKATRRKVALPCLCGHIRTRN